METTITQELIDSRFTLDQQIRDALGSAFEDFGMEGINYVVSETKRIAESLQTDLKPKN